MRTTQLLRHALAACGSLTIRRTPAGTPRGARSRVIAVLTLLASVLACSAAPAVAGTTELVSVDSAGIQGNAGSFDPSLSGDGRFVAFGSVASNLVPGDTNGLPDVFVHDRHTGITERVSVSSDGTQGNGQSGDSSISADGRFVAFWTGNNLVPGDTNGWIDVFVHDRHTGITERVSVDSAGVEGNNPSGSFGLSLSADGRFVAFQSFASNLVPGDFNSAPDVFVHDRHTGLTERVSIASAGTEGNHVSGFHGLSLSADGRFVAFMSAASNLVPHDTNGTDDVFVHDRQTGTTERVSVSSAGTQGNSVSLQPSLSADGRFVAFTSGAKLVRDDTNGAVDVFVHDRQTGITERVSVDSAGIQGNAGSFDPSLSADGRFVAFTSDATNLVPGDTNDVRDVFVHDRQTGTTERVSVKNNGTQGNEESVFPSLSADGRFVAFFSRASNLVRRDMNGVGDVFVHDRGNLAEAEEEVDDDD